VATKTVQVETTAQAYVALLRERGIEYLFANEGTDFAPLIDAFARCGSRIQSLSLMGCNAKP